MWRYVVCLWLMLLVPFGQAAETAFGPINPANVAVDYREGAYFAQLSFRAAVPPALALEVLTDFDHMASFVPNLQGSRIISRVGDVYRIAQHGQARFGFLSFSFESERSIELLPDGRLIAQALSGSTKYMRSEMVVQAIAGGSSLNYQIKMVPDRWLPSTLGSNFMRHELAEQFNAMLHEMERRQKSRLPH